MQKCDSDVYYKVALYCHATSPNCELSLANSASLCYFVLKASFAQNIYPQLEAAWHNGDGETDPFSFS